MYKFFLAAYIDIWFTEKNSFLYCLLSLKFLSKWVYKCKCYKELGYIIHMKHRVFLWEVGELVFLGKPSWSYSVENVPSWTQATNNRTFINNDDIKIKIGDQVFYVIPII